jgi:DNA polymerase-4
MPRGVEGKLPIEGVDAVGSPDGRQRWVLYVDLDAYYVSCEVRDRPELAGRAVIVGPPPSAGPTRGVVLSASYEARKFGVHSAMPAAAAARLAPDAVWVAPDFPKYVQTAREVRGLLRRFSPAVLPFSIDEAAIVLEGVTPAEVRARAVDVQRGLREELGLPASLGASTTRVVAKIATDRAKPGGIVVVPTEEVGAFLGPLPVRVIPGVGPKTEAALTALGVRTIGDLAMWRSRELWSAVGGFSRELVALARGHPSESVDVDLGPRGRSTDHTFAEDVGDWDHLASAIVGLAESLGSSLEEEGLRYATVGVAFRWSDFSRSQHGRTLSGATEGDAALREAAVRLGRELWEKATRSRPRAVRTVSVRVGRLTARSQRQSVLDALPTDPLPD